MVEKRLYQQREEEKSIRPFQTGTGIEYLTDEERYGFDITGYLILEDFLSAGQVREASRQLQVSQVNPLEHVTLRRNGPETELLNVVECGGMLEQACVHGRLVQAMQQLIWGDQIRLVSSRAIARKPGISGHVSQGGLADPRRYTRYRCFIDGEFRCLLVSCLIALNDTASGDGAFSVIPSSHKSNFPPPLRTASSRERCGPEGSPTACGLRRDLQREHFPLHEEFPDRIETLAAVSVRSLLHGGLAGLRGVSRIDAEGGGRRDQGPSAAKTLLSPLTSAGNRSHESRLDPSTWNFGPGPH